MKTRSERLNDQAHGKYIKKLDLLEEKSEKLVDMLIKKGIIKEQQREIFELVFSENYLDLIK